jgi:hypothetical protein
MDAENIRERGNESPVVPGLGREDVGKAYNFREPAKY